MTIRLAEVLEEQGRSVTWFCRRMNCDRSLYYRILSGERTATLDFQLKSAALLGVPASFIFLPQIVPSGIENTPNGTIERVPA